ncbi:MAG: hypothetical protein EOL93_01830 [Epsilonproteobacteria bacterium]|nr:hypothetical protein [Campylobacterota bacterium]
MIFVFDDKRKTAVMLGSIYEMNCSESRITVYRMVNSNPSVTFLEYVDEKKCNKDYRKATRSWSEYVEAAAFGEENSRLGFDVGQNGSATEEDYDENDAECRRIGF